MTTIFLRSMPVRPISPLLLVLAAILISASSTDALAQPGTVFSHADLDSVLRRFVDGAGRVDYAGLKTDSGMLDRYVSQLARVGPQTAPHLFLSREDSLAYWINAYNALVLFGVVEAYPVSSVRKIGRLYGFFKLKKFRIDGGEMTLDHIEHDIVRAQFGDPRIHAAINCGAKSCPKLRREVFMPGALNHQLEEAMREMVRSPVHVRLDYEKRELHLSRIFDWFSSDFTTWIARKYGRENASLVDYILLFCRDDMRGFLEQNRDVRIRFDEYDWSLNQQ